MEDLKEGNYAYFISAENRWSLNALGFAWLRRFNKDTRLKSSRRRLLIANSHSSHVNYGLVRLADQLRTFVLVLPSYTTHRLHPLDIGMFSPLSTAYSKELNKYTDARLE
jgi:DDE superfamily endonuclease